MHSSSFPPAPSLSGVFPAVAAAPVTPIPEIAWEIFRSVAHVDADARNWLLHHADYSAEQWRQAIVLATDALRCAEAGEAHPLIVDEG